MSADKAESDVAADPNLATSRATGGVPDADDPNQESTTSTTPTPEYVGRVAGDDVGYAGETGAERRAAAQASPSDASGDTTAQGNPGRPQSDFGSRDADDVPDDTSERSSPI